jgi:serine protease Do
MTAIFRRPVPVRLFHALTALVFILAGRDFSDPTASAREPATDRAPASPLQEPYQDPEAVVEHFKAELERLANEKDQVSPADLVGQADEAKTCTARTLPDPGRQLPPEEIYQRARRSVVVIGGIRKRRRGDGYTTYCAAGFVVSKDGLVATNYHLLPAFQGMESLGVMTHDGKVFPVKKVAAADKHNDVAVLKIEAADLVPLPIAADIPIGAKVYCLSHPALNSGKTENAFYAFTPGTVSGKYRLRIAGKDLVNVLTVTADYAVGSSGAPILNEHGAAVGLACETLSVFHNVRDADVQMVWKFTRPASALLALFKDPPEKR